MKLPIPSFEGIKNAPAASDGSFEAPLLLVPGLVLFPRILSPLTLTDERQRSVLERAIQQKRTLLIAAAQMGDDGLVPIAPIATEAAVQRFPDAPQLTVLLQGRRRVRLLQATETNGTWRAQAHELPEQGNDEADNAAGIQALHELFQQIASYDENIAPSVLDLVLACEEASYLSDLIANALPFTLDERQAWLAEADAAKRIAQLQTRLTQQLSELEARTDINSRVQSDMARIQRDGYLREQLRVIQSELGETDPFTREIETLRSRILQARMPDEVQAKALEELDRLGMMPPLSPESGIVHTYLDWLITLPWVAKKADNLNLAHAEKSLNQAHYGLKKVKERILEYIAVRKLAGKAMKSPILCFVGPPGVGKTSLGKSIAEALGREFVRVSLGGVRDEAEIRGHRRTYIGALPGRILQTMKRAGTLNPVFMLDEIDKMSADFRGDPAAALLEVLDPEQNNAFLDHYLDVPFDLSQVLFIATANDLEPLPEALEDRLEVIEFQSYTEEEKLEIARQFLIPRQLEAHGLKRRGIQLQHSALQTIVRQYTQEAGVRNLEREIGTVCRKLARQVASKQAFPKRITPKLVEKYLGPPYVLESRVNRQDSYGLVTGLVWSASGGDTQTIEVSILPGKGNLTLTGQLGDVLQESAQAAYSYTRSRAYELGIPSDDFEDYDVHVHLPEGAVPKDGPSAGAALTTAILSAFTEQPVRSDAAMTGEVTLRGNILPVGGVKEKVLAARRRGIKHVILPEDNRKDLVDIPRAALADLELHFVRTMPEVLALMLGPAPAQRQRDLIAQQEAASSSDDGDNDNES